MSMINDALKRAKESQQQQPQTPAGASPLPPVETESRGSLGWLLVLLLLIAVAGIFIFLAFGKYLVQKTPVVSAAPAAVVMPPPKPAPPVAPKTNTVTVTVPPKPLPPVLKLQGIFFNSGSPQAIVNGHTVFVGDTVAGFRVKIISKDNVSLIAPDGTQKTLGLGE